RGNVKGVLLWWCNGAYCYTVLTSASSNRGVAIIFTTKYGTMPPAMNGELRMTLMIETVTPPEQGTFHLELQLAADIRVPADAARKSVSAFVGREIGDLLHGDRPDLVWGA